MSGPAKVAGHRLPDTGPGSTLGHRRWDTAIYHGPWHRYSPHRVLITWVKFQKDPFQTGMTRMRRKAHSTLGPRVGGLLRGAGPENYLWTGHNG